jgi:hypothetical protein
VNRIPADLATIATVDLEVFVPNRRATARVHRIGDSGSEDVRDGSEKYETNTTMHLFTMCAGNAVATTIGSQRITEQNPLGRPGMISRFTGFLIIDLAALCAHGFRPIINFPLYG